MFYPLRDNEDKYKPVDPMRLKFAETVAVHRWHHLWFGRHKDKVVRPWDKKVGDLEGGGWGNNGGGWVAAGRVAAG